MASQPAAAAEPGTAAGKLRLLSFNIQAGTNTRAYRDYWARPWSHVLPHREKRGHLDSIAELAAPFDVVGLQESDPGSLRSGFLNQTHYLAERAGFPFWSHQPNRRVAGIASSANGLLSRREPDEVRDYPLPGRVPGRGALWSRFGEGADALVVVVAHLSLSIQARMGQLAFLAEVLADAPHVVLMGDFNCAADSREMQNLYKRTALRPPNEVFPTFPAWQPVRAIDHILTSEPMLVARRWVVPEAWSDHLAIAAEITLPAPSAS